jgi:hypothetical protein
MTNDELCMALMRADSEVEVVALLTDCGYWGDANVWRYLGDNDNNYSSIGNQQSEAVAALIEKVVNGVDARLMNAAWVAGINPESTSAPQTIRAAVTRFFEDDSSDKSEHDGRISAWPDDKATAEGRLLTLSATGFRPEDGMPSISVADQGEGQEPDCFGDTFLSLQRSNKLRVHFVQGKFNMGGTGAFQFCSGEHKLQLIVSRRNPVLVKPDSPGRASEWGFTIVRREWPKDGGRSSVFTYLAPHAVSEPMKGTVLSFPALTWPIFPEANDKIRDAYARHSEYGSLIKLYEYEWQGTKSNIVYSGGGLLMNLDLGLPEVALPVRVFECRKEYKGHSGSFATNVLGLSARLHRDRAANLEPDIAPGSVIHLDGCEVKVRLFAFKPGKDKDYRRARQGVVFSVNGQSHATFSTEFYRRKTVGMSYLASSLLVLVDCSAIDGQMREDLFMNSRDRLRDTPLARRLEKELESLIKNEPSLKALRNRRRSEELSEKLADSKPLTAVLQDILKNQPTLAKLLLQGVKLTSPFPPANTAGGGNSGGEFHGKTYPTYFRFKGLKDGEALIRDARLESRTRITLETDADDEYFMRELDPGASRLVLVDGEEETEIDNWSIQGPRSGSSSLTLFDLPSDAKVGTEIDYRLEITDPSRVDAFLNRFTLQIKPAAPSNGGGGGAGSSNNSEAGTGGGASMLQLPNIREVTQDEWETRGFNELTALRILSAGDDDGGQAEIYDFYVNVDNKFLRIIEKETKDEPKLIKAKFIYGLVLVGLALLQDHRTAPAIKDEDSESKDANNVEKLVETTTRAIAPVLLPMLESIGALDINEDD